MLEVRFHGRGGQGVVMASRLLAEASVISNLYGTSFPMFGFERRGAPVVSFCRLNDTPIRLKTQINNPDIIVVLDAFQNESSDVWKGLKPTGIAILNSKIPFNKKINGSLKCISIVDAEKISIEEIGMSMPNTAMIGAFAKASKLIKYDAVIQVLKDSFSGNKLKANIKCFERGFKETLIKNLQ